MHDNNITAEQTLIDAFISGLKSDELSMKLSQKDLGRILRLEIHLLTLISTILLH